MPTFTVEEEQKKQSERGRRQRASRVLTPLEQIRVPSAGTTGAWCYYLRPDGATIRDALVISPNGGIPDIDDPKMRARYGMNHAEYRATAAAKGFEFLGSKLSPEAVTKLVRTMAKNREDEVLFCQEEIADCEEIAHNSDLPANRDHAKRRKAQFQRRLDTILAPFDADALLAELSEIARAQMLADVDPNVLRVMRSMIGEVNENMAAAIQKFSTGKVSDDPDAPKRRVGRPPKGENGADFSGVDFVDADN